MKNNMIPDWNRISKLIDLGYTALEKRENPVMTENWMRAWDMVEELVRGSDMPIGINDLDEATDYEYNLVEWLYDMEMELWNAKEYEKRLLFCQTVLDIFDWQYDDKGGYMTAVAESLYALNRKEEGEAWLNKWLEEEPHNMEAVNAKCICLEMEGKEEEAYVLLEQEIGEQDCTLENDLLFAKICGLSEKLGKADRLEYYQEKYRKFEEKIKETGDLPFFDGLPFIPSIPVVKPEKIYPNDPCPCGSGKKYKKCCGRNK